tara:strand:+ start:203 stop:313 length:111 start_codon:yes stop_codon:yes gene_type:complete
VLEAVGVLATLLVQVRVGQVAVVMLEHTIQTLHQQR